MEKKTIKSLKALLKFIGENNLAIDYYGGSVQFIVLEDDLYLNSILSTRIERFMQIDEVEKKFNVNLAILK